MDPVCNSTMHYRLVSDPEDDQNSGDLEDAQKVQLNHFIEYQKTAYSQVGVLFLDLRIIGASVPLSGYILYIHV